MLARGIAHAAAADMGGKTLTQAERMPMAPMGGKAMTNTESAMMMPHGSVYAMAPAYMPAYTPPTYSSYPMSGHEDEFMAQHPSAVMSYPDRTVGYQYAAGAPVTPYMSPAASRPVPRSSLMSMMRNR
jgi:hypothetical protein